MSRMSMRSKFTGWRQTLHSVIGFGGEQGGGRGGEGAHLLVDDADPPVFHAVCRHDFAALERAIANDPSAPYIETAEGYTLLHLAASLEGDAACQAVGMLLASNKFDINDRMNNSKFTPLHVACSRGSLSDSDDPMTLPRMLLKEGAEVHHEAEKGSLPVEYLVRAKECQTIEFRPLPVLLEVLRVFTMLLTGMDVAGVSFDRVHRRGVTLLGQCVSHGAEYFVKLLVANGANVHTTIHGRTLQQVALDSGHAKVAKLVEHLVSVTPPPALEGAIAAEDEDGVDDKDAGGEVTGRRHAPTMLTAPRPVEPQGEPLKETLCVVVCEATTARPADSWDPDPDVGMEVVEGVLFFPTAETTDEYIGGVADGRGVWCIAKAAVKPCAYGRNSLVRQVLLKLIDSSDAPTSREALAALRVQEHLEEDWLREVSSRVVLIQSWCRRWIAIKRFRANSLPRGRVRELIDNERAYVEALSIMEEKLRQPLASAGLDSLIPPLRWVPSLIPVHTKIHKNLEDVWGGRLSADPAVPAKEARYRYITDVINDFIPVLKMYRQLVPELGQYQPTFEGIRSANPEFDRIVTDFTQNNIPPRSNTHANDPSMWFMRMFQHLTKYHLMFKDILKDLNSSLKKFRSVPPLVQGMEVAKTRDALHALTSDVNKNMSDPSVHEAVLDAQNAIVVKEPRASLTLVAPHRTFVHSQVFTRVDNRSFVRVLVFSDIFLLLALPSGKSTSSIYSGEFISHYHMLYARVFDLPDIPEKNIEHALQITVFRAHVRDRASKSITLACTCAAERSRFCNLFRRQIQLIQKQGRISVVPPVRPPIFEGPVQSLGSKRVLTRSSTNMPDAPSHQQSRTESPSRVPSHPPPPTVLWVDRWVHDRTVPELYHLEQKNPNVRVVQLYCNRELARYLTRNKDDLMRIRSNNLRIMSNSFRERDGGQTAPERLERMLRSNEDWENVPIMVYCGKRTKFQHLHRPADRIWVTTSQSDAVNFMAMKNLSTPVDEGSRLSVALPQAWGHRRTKSSGSAEAIIIEDRGAAEANTSTRVESAFVAGRNRRKRRSRIFIGDGKAKLKAVLEGTNETNDDEKAAPEEASPSTRGTSQDLFPTVPAVHVEPSTPPISDDVVKDADEEILDVPAAKQSEEKEATEGTEGGGKKEGARDLPSSSGALGEEELRESLSFQPPDFSPPPPPDSDSDSE